MTRVLVKNLICIFIFFIIAKCNIVFAAPYNMCNGREFNKRVKMFLSGGDSNWDKDYTITIFERGYNPPSDKAYYVDISEDMDGTVIAYARENELYYYSDSDVAINGDCAYMFDKFIRMRNIDLSGFVYFDLKDVRYMFASCHHLKTLKFKSKSANKKNIDRKWEPSEIQGMFFDCQSLVNVDLSRFDTHHINNMDEVFYKCYNIKNIYVDKTSWTVEDVYSCNRMFASCHVLKTNKGRKASDIATDNYLQYAIPGSGKDVDDNKKIEGLLKDINTEYDDYGERDGTAPVDADYYAVQNTSPTITYADEPEGDGGDGQGGSGDGLGTGNTPFVGDRSTGYYAEKEGLTTGQVIVPSSEASPIDETTIVETSRNIDIVESSNVIETTEIVETTKDIQINNETQIVTTEVIETTKETQKMIETTENILPDTRFEITPQVETINNEIVEENNNNQRRVMELDDYLREQGLEGKEGKGDGLGGKQEESINYRFMLFAIIVLTIAILLLVGVVVFLVNDKKENNDNGNL